MDTTSWLQELIQALNNLNQDINNSESPIGKLDALLTTKHPGPKFSREEYETALKECNINYLNPKVDRLWKLLQEVKDVQQDTN